MADTGERIRAARALHDAGRSVDALDLAAPLGPPRTWSGVEACITGARLAGNMGAPTLATRLSLRAFQSAPLDVRAQCQFAYELHWRRGPLAVWRAMQHWPVPESAEPADRAERLAVEAFTASDLRDFHGAERLLDAAEALCPNDPWITLQRAHHLENQDRVEEALDLVLTARSYAPHRWYRLGLQHQGRLLQQLDRDDEAIALLWEAHLQLQNAPLTLQLHALLSENGRFAEADQVLDRLLMVTPLRERSMDEFIASARVHSAYRRGLRDEAMERATAIGDPYHQAFVERLRSSERVPDRVSLDVTFVRQHFKTCAPATLASIGDFFSMPAEHVRMAEAMCYDGTPSWEQRDWATRNGWSVREFRVTAESAQELTSRGLPFAVSTVDATSAHMMAVIGYDRVKGVLLLRDPGQPYVVEALEEGFLERYASFGPAGMVFVPEDRASELHSDVLPDCTLHDAYHGLSRALGAHQRDDAASALQDMIAQAPDATLTWDARLALASYDDHATEQLRCLDVLIARAPTNAARLLRRHHASSDHSTTQRIAWLRDRCHPTTSDPALLVALARMLIADARAHTEAERLIERALRRAPLDTGAIAALADLRWQQSRLEEAARLMRRAAELEEFREGPWQSWFTLSRKLGNADAAVAVLRERVERYGLRSAQPAMTLAWALRELDRPAEAQTSLDEALLRRPDDGELLLRAAELAAARNDAQRSQERLAAARGRVRDVDWWRFVMTIAENRFEYARVVEAASEILAMEPVAIDAIAARLRGTVRLHGTAAAVAELQAQVERFPDHRGLRRMLVEWSRDEGPTAARAAADAFLARDPDDAWVRRERALALCEQGAHAEALADAQHSLVLEPEATWSHSVLGRVLQAQQRPMEAAAAFRRAIALSADNGFAVDALLSLAETDEARRQELGLVADALANQTVEGDGLLTFVAQARATYSGDALLDRLTSLHDQRPDLWHTWSALVAQLGHMNRYDDALAMATRATERFPHVPRAWLDLSQVHQWMGNLEAERSATAQAFELNPAWPYGALLYTDALEREGALDDADAVYRRALALVPRDARLHAAHASALWRMGRSDEALQAVERALRYDPEHEWAGRQHRDMLSDTADQERGPAFLRSLTTEQPGNAATWLLLARGLELPAHAEEVLGAIDRALELMPASQAAWTLKVEVLCAIERFDAAAAACSEGVSRGPSLALELRGRGAWVEAQRRRHGDAIRLMREVLRDNVGYAWGWAQLGDWLLQEGDEPGAIDALDTLSRLNPHDAWTHARVGQLRLRARDRRGAHDAFQRALAVNPTDASTAHTLFDAVLVEDKDEAAAILDVMRLHQPGAPTAAAELKYQLLYGERREAMEALTRIVTAPGDQTWAIRSASEALRLRHAAREAIRVVLPIVREGRARPEAAALLMELFLARGAAYSATTAFWRLSPAEAAAAAPALSQALGKGKQRFLLRLLTRWRRDALRATDQGWALTGYALLQTGQTGAVVQWLADWRERPGALPWMLFNLCVSLRHLGRYDEADAVARHVVKHWEHREGADDMRLFLAVEDAIAGRTSDASAHLARVVTRSDNDHDQILLALAREVVAAQTATDQPQVMSSLERLSQHFPFWSHGFMVRDLRHSLWRARSRYQPLGGLWAKLWFGARRYWFGLAAAVVVALLLLVRGAVPTFALRMFVPVVVGAMLARRFRGS